MKAAKADASEHYQEMEAVWAAASTDIPKMNSLIAAVDSLIEKMKISRAKTMTKKPKAKAKAK
eukprot:1442212-Alexandrium_andersonii.AAC.1